MFLKKKTIEHIMLEEISIKDLGVIQSATLKFTPGLTVLTGETGAGKTMVLSALGLLLGKRSDSSVVRHGSEFTSVEGCWNVTGLAVLPEILETGAVVEDGQLFLNRTVYKDGKSRAVIGGKSTPASLLATIGEGLVSIHGQSDQIRLKNSTAQREALDSYAGAELAAELKTYKEIFAEWKALTIKVSEIKSHMFERQREYENLVIAVEELDKAQPVKDEDTTLRTEALALSNTEALSEAIQTSLNYLTSEEYDVTDVTAAISNIVKALSSVAEFDPKVAELNDLAITVQEQVNDLASGLASHLSGIDMDVIERLNQIQERIAVLNGLIRKYGPTLDDVIEFWETSSVRMADLDPEGSNIEVLESKLAETYMRLELSAGLVTGVRKRKSVELQDQVNAELAGLAMAGNKLQIGINKANDYASYGIDDISFMLLTPGASEARPLNKSASGGELSRIMLALEVVLADPNETPTFLFDEVDAGLGGSTAIEVGKRLALLSKEAQVIVVTHLPQVAAFADNHMRVLKTNNESFTSTDVTQLNESERVEELARMLSGLNDSETGRAHALELVEMASEFKSR